MTAFISVSISLVKTPPPSFSRRAECWDLSCSTLIVSLVAGLRELMSLQGLLPSGDLGGLDFVEETVDTGVDQWGHDLGRHTTGQHICERGKKGNVRRVLGLLEELSETGTSVEEVSGGSIQIGTELGESCDFSVLGEVKLQGTGNRLHEFGLGGGTDSRDGETDVDCWSDTLEEELGLQEDLSVGDRNDVGRNVGRDITTLGLDNGEGSEGTGTVRLVHLGGSLE
jgi:hypothetical protein